MKNNILLIEDNAGDIALIKLGLKTSINTQLNKVISDGEEAMDYLKLLEEADHPDLIILDLNLPRVSGFEILTYLKKSILLRHIPIVVLSSTELMADIDQAYLLNANCFITKPIDLDDFISKVTAIDKFWFEVAQV